MPEHWADITADRIAGALSPARGSFLFLGAADTGKTTLVGALAGRLADSQRVALIDADIGQSHIGPPTTVGWTLLDGADKARAALPPSAEGATELAPRGIAFVGDVTPVGHLLQLTAALALCVEQAARLAEVILIDTPGLVTGGAACTLWWTVQRLLRPEQIIAVQRENELAPLLEGLQAGISVIERIETPLQFRRKSPEARQEHRKRLFRRYFQGATTHTVDLGTLAVRASFRAIPENTVGRLVGLTDATGQDIAIGIIERWRNEKATGSIRAPHLHMQDIRCLTIGDVRMDTPFGWS